MHAHIVSVDTYLCPWLNVSIILTDQVKREAHSLEMPLKHGSRGGGDLLSVFGAAPAYSLVPF